MLININLMKNIIISFFAISTLMVLTACGGSSTKTNANNNSEDSAASVSPVKEDHMFFMDLELGGNPEQFISTLQQRGFTKGSGFSDDKSQVFLKGEVYGEMAELSIDTSEGKVNSVTITNDLDAFYSMKQAAKRSQNLMEKVAEQYDVEWETICDGFYELKLPYGKATCSYASGCAAGYEVVMTIVDSVETE